MWTLKSLLDPILVLDLDTKQTISTFSPIAWKEKKASSYLDILAY